MSVVDVIKKKRDGHALSDDEILAFVTGVTDGSISDYQAAALLMAICLRGMDERETTTLTYSMVDSGVVLNLARFDGVAVDKHSTGGVGDKTSIVIAPVAAACGVLVPMMSGRGLGHTGGTLDKLESIPGFRTRLSIDEMFQVIDAAGCALIGQTKEIAPADRKLYALRDVTGTVESLPLICSSIMSKKVAEGLDALVLDVKVGRGAFMPDLERARALARVLVDTGTQARLRTEALITNMDTPLGCAVGNALEIAECIEVLKGRGPADLVELCELLAARMLVLAGIESDEDSARARARAAIADGSALDKFGQIIELQEGDRRVIDDPSRLPAAERRQLVKAPRAGYLGALHADIIGRASVLLGAGRARVDSAIDPAAGIVLLRRPGEQVAEGDALLELHYNDGFRLARAEALIAEAFEIVDAPPPPVPLVFERVMPA